MSEREHDFMLEILDDLDKDSMERFIYHLNTKGIDGKTIPKGKFEGANAVKVAILLKNRYYPEHLEALRDTLNAIHNRRLAEKVSIEIDAAKKKRENQTEEMDGIPPKRSKCSEVPQYTGDYRLPTMQDYAIDYQDLLIEKLKEYLEPNAFKILEEQLARRKLKKAFSFTATQYYSLVTNQDLKCFLDNVSWSKQKQIPSKILDVLFSPYKSNKKAQQKSQPQEKKPIPFHPNSTGKQKLNNEREEGDEKGEGDERKELPENKQKGNPQISKEDTFTWEFYMHCHEEGERDESKELLENKQIGYYFPQIIKEDTFTEEPDVDYGEEEGDERKELPELKPLMNCYEEEGDERKELPENKQMGDPQIPKEEIFTKELDINCDEQGEGDEKKEEQRNSTLKMKNEWYENSARAIRKHYKGKKFCIEMLENSEHKKYQCFIAQDVILLKFKEETEYHLFQMLQDKKATKKGNLKKIVEFELQFNMAVLNVQSCVCICNDIPKSVKANFRNHEKDLENIVSVIVLPVLALYKRVKLNKYFPEFPGVEEQMTTQIHIYST